MQREKAIELLSDYCDRGVMTLNDDFKEAVRTGKQALVLFGLAGTLILDNESIQFLLGVERRKHV